ncbi:ATP-binding cassette domain-containing protein [Mesorhizobium sp. 1B3]|uniref:ATP-binding cassette domain-containing protein n=1 Tax=Mesorhizobium sp. 1B3 TaxID=3243599 RepID=UPI003D986ABB
MSKSFGGARVLDGVSLELARGEILGLLGHNGSGKSTLIKCLAGFHWPDRIERLELNGGATTAAAAVAGRRIAFVHQDLGLVHGLTILENFLLTDRRALSGLSIPWKELRASVGKALRRFGVDFPLDTRIDSLSQADRCLIAVVRAVETLSGDDGDQVLVLDEPTPFLPASGVAKLFTLMRSFARAGGSIIFVAHDIDEVREITDRIVVLRNGRRVAGFDTRTTGRDEIIGAIVGQTLQHHHVRRGDAGRLRGDSAWQVSGLTGAGVVDCNFTVAPGEILGVTGLIGSGAASVPELLTGACQAAGGTLRGPGQAAPDEIDLARIPLRELMARNVFLLPDDRLRKSGVGELTMAENIALPALPRFTRAMRLMRKPLRQHIETVLRHSGAIPADPNMDLHSFSGGNQQKALIAKWLALSPRILALSEPTQGVDVGSRQSIYAAIEGAALRGAAVVCYSSDAGELEQICDRVLILSGGRITAELAGETISKDAIVSATLGMTGPATQEMKRGALERG